MKAFENLKYSQLKTLLNVTNGTKVKSLEVIRKRHQISSDNFSGAITFLKKLNILVERKDKVDVKKEFQISVAGLLGDETLRGMLLKELLTTKSKLTQKVLNYLEKFNALQSTFEYKPTTAIRVKESPLRNLLIELELIEYDRATGIYKIKEKHFDAFEIFLQQKKLSPNELALILKRKEDLGKAAELTILTYEKGRLANHPELLEKIEYVAENNVNAGYDILSWEMESKNEKPVARYVEVKAVSLNSSQFYWTRNEVEKAMRFTDQYHLYLLPVVSRKKFNVRGLKIIPNPIVNVYDNAKLWSKQVETFMFSKIDN